MAVWVVAATLQITQQALFPEVRPSPYGSCAAGLQHLELGLGRARQSAAEGDEDPDEALRRFRLALDPEWLHLEGVRASCRGEAELRGLDALERLRYAEEHAVRREAASLAALRRRVDSELPQVGAERLKSPPPDAPRKEPP